ncbi:MAG: response regulator [bacterium]|nr:response regulator [bacterium]
MSKILIVDDDKKIALALAARLKANGFDVRTAHDGMFAVSFAVKEQPDLIIMDINMPAGSGIQAAERIQNIASTTGVPIIFITASKDPALRAAASEVGAAAILDKPFESEDLVSMIRSTLHVA